MRRAALLVVAVACGSATPAPTPSNHAATAPAAGPPPMPGEVVRFIERWEMCQHWLGEEPYDAARRAEIERGVAASCAGNDTRINQLQTKYADRPDVVAKLRALPE